MQLQLVLCQLRNRVELRLGSLLKHCYTTSPIPWVPEGRGGFFLVEHKQALDRGLAEPRLNRGNEILEK